MGGWGASRHSTVGGRGQRGDLWADSALLGAGWRGGGERGGGLSVRGGGGAERGEAGLLLKELLQSRCFPKLKGGKTTMNTFSVKGETILQYKTDGSQMLFPVGMLTDERLADG